VAITLSNLNQFSTFFHLWILQKICSKVIIKEPTAPYMCCYTTLWKRRKLLLSVCGSRERCSARLSWFRSACRSWASQTWSSLIQEQRCEQRLLLWCAPVTAAVANDADVSAEFFIFQQDSAPAHRTRDTMRLHELATPASIPLDQWPPNSPDLNPGNHKIWTIVQQRVFRNFPWLFINARILKIS